MVESLLKVKAIKADYKVALLIAHQSQDMGPPFAIPQVIQDLDLMKNFIKSLNFDEVVPLVDKQATAQAVDDFFAKLAVRSMEHRDRQSGGKLLFFIYYSGHGINQYATQRVKLDHPDPDVYYPLELKIRQFKNQYPNNTYNFGLFDTCRVSTEKDADSVGPMQVKAGVPIELNYTDYRPRDSNLVLIFTSEPSNVTYVNDKATYALVDFLMKKQQSNGQILIPLDLDLFNHLATTEVTHSCSDYLVLEAQIEEKPKITAEEADEALAAIWASLEPYKYDEINRAEDIHRVKKPKIILPSSTALEFDGLPTAAKLLSIFPNWGTKQIFYTGQWDQQGRRDGRGVFVDGYNFILEGNWKNGQLIRGRQIYKNGRVYEGHFQNNIRNGHGVFIWPDGNKYEGEWKDNQRNGKARMTYATGEQYEGEYKDGKYRNGVFTWADGNKYEGEFKDDEMNGKGVFTSAAGDKYEGEFKDGKYNGKGVFTSANGNKYEGEYKDNNKNGKGVYTYADGDKYDGQWQDDKKHGAGVYTYSDGRVVKGTFKNGEFVE